MTQKQLTEDQLTEEQLAVLSMPPEGHHVVLGTAGSGKTNLAVLRAVRLSQNLASSRPVKIIAFNNTLVKYIDSNLDIESKSVSKQ